MLVACREGGREGETNLIHLFLVGAKHLVALCECFLKLFKLFRVEGELSPQLCLMLRQLLTASLLLQTLPQQLQEVHHLQSHSSHSHHSTVTLITDRVSPVVSLAG